MASATTAAPAATISASSIRPLCVCPIRAIARLRAASVRYASGTAVAIAATARRQRRASDAGTAGAREQSKRDGPIGSRRHLVAEQFADPQRQGAVAEDRKVQQRQTSGRPVPEQACGGETGHGRHGPCAGDGADQRGEEQSRKFHGGFEKVEGTGRVVALPRRRTTKRDRSPTGSRSMARRLQGSTAHPAPGLAPTFASNPPRGDRKNHETVRRVPRVRQGTQVRRSTTSNDRAGCGREGFRTVETTRSPAHSMMEVGVPPCECEIERGEEGRGDDGCDDDGCDDEERGDDGRGDDGARVSTHRRPEMSDRSSDRVHPPRSIGGRCRACGRTPTLRTIRIMNSSDDVDRQRGESDGSDPPAALARHARWSPCARGASAAIAAKSIEAPRGALP